MRQSLNTSLRAAACGLVILFCCAANANAQFRAGVQGTVTDAGGAVVPGATVRLTSRETNKSQTTMSSDDGFYRFDQLAPGSYSLTAEKSGFKKQVLENLVVSAEALQGVDLVLTTGDISESVTVTDTAASQLETENANVTKSITTREVRELPQVGRDPYELLRLTPGIFGSGARSGSGNAVNLPNTAGPGGSNSSVFQTENQVPISANGQRVSANNFQVDGVSVNSLGWGGAAVVSPNQESVKEVRVKSSTYSAEDGRNSGAQISVVSQNGTNQYHGSLLFKYNSPGLNAFNKYDGPTIPRQRVEHTFRQFGGSLGGPLYLPRFGEGGPATWGGKDKLFFFLSYEGVRENTNQSRITVTETPEFRQLVRTTRPNTLAARLFSTAGIAPRVVSVLPASCAALPGLLCRAVGSGLDIGSPTGTPGVRFTDPFSPAGRAGGGLDNIPDIQFAQVAFPNRLRGHQFNGRVDYIRGNDTFALSTYFTRRGDLQTDFGNPQSRPVADLTFEPLNSAATTTWNHVLSPTMLNEARFNFTRFAFNQVESSTRAGTDFGIPYIKVEGLGVVGGNVGQVTLPNTIFFGANRAETTPGIFAQNTFEVRDTLTKTRGNHGLKFGGELRWEQDNSNLAGGARPQFGFFTLFGLANDVPIFEEINTDPTTGGAADLQRYFRTKTIGLFGQDDWKARPNLTLNFGLRWEYFSPLTEKRGKLSNFVLGPAGQELTGGRVVVVDHLFEPDRNNFAPRVGFAWSPRRLAGQDFRDSLVLRGGFGVAYNRIFNNILSNVRGNPPFAARRFECCAFTPGDADAIRRIFYTFGRDNSPFGYPVNPNLTPGIDPRTGSLRDSSVELYGSLPDLPNAYVYSYSFGGEYLLPRNFIAEIGYQGSNSHKLIRTTNLNYVFDADNPA
ncbi:MAG: TonB-dependent receptor, partial [Acidobacteria bacterium]|nr:TonB-dependent receptor [Acidobacteriota bacterium]